MAKMIIMIGLPASGKSTKAKQIVEEYGNVVRINKDLLRTMLHFDKFTYSNEKHTRDAARKLADWFLSQGISVIIDDTNLNDSTKQSWVDLAKIHNAQIEYIRFYTPVNECIVRDLSRQKKVGKSVIQKMAMQYCEYMDGEVAIVCDLDGTLCDIEHRRHFVRGEKKDWKSFFEHIPQDNLREDVFKQLLEHETDRLILVSARPETYRKETEEWLEKNLIFYDVLIMREANDKRPDTEVKADIFEKYLKNLNIVKVFDDRPSVIRMWKEKGLDVVDVGNGEEF